TGFLLHIAVDEAPSFFYAQPLASFHSACFLPSFLFSSCFLPFLHPCPVVLPGFVVQWRVCVKLRQSRTIDSAPPRSSTTRARDTATSTFGGTMSKPGSLPMRGTASCAEPSAPSAAPSMTRPALLVGTSSSTTGTRSTATSTCTRNLMANNKKKERSCSWR